MEQTLAASGFLDEELGGSIMESGAFAYRPAIVSPPPNARSVSWGSTKPSSRNNRAGGAGGLGGYPPASPGRQFTTTHKQLIPQVSPPRRHRGNRADRIIEMSDSIASTESV